MERQIGAAKRRKVWRKPFAGQRFMALRDAVDRIAEQE
jgi:hypothetical protein